MLLVLTLSTLALGGCNRSPELCRQTAQRLAERDHRCGVYTATADAYEILLEGPNCDGAFGVRDEAALIEVCWPALEAASCSLTPPLPEACDEQF